MNILKSLASYKMKEKENHQGLGKAIVNTTSIKDEEQTLISPLA